MAGTFTGKSLAEGQVATSEGDLYLVPSSTVGYVKKLHLFNTSATTQTCDVYIKRSGLTTRRIRRVVLAQYESAELENIGPLAAGDAIRALTTTATVLDFVATGTEET